MGFDWCGDRHDWGEVQAPEKQVPARIYKLIAMIEKRSGQLKIKKFLFFAKEIRIVADREVSRGDSRIDSHLPWTFQV
ncbi:hypothetical protein [Pseudomonas syringae]|uniref:Uncharacterized protein n=1 Tax=Pseudomonas syringae TaxID=317 RepID=A0A085VND4_PSESX|nr:hypothetical protein [Pseudomonas syringae]KFE56947.1 hypothetical protein IV01_07145 [Pseudomonas syringae]